MQVGNCSFRPRLSASFVERMRSLSFDFKSDIITVGLRMMRQRERQIWAGKRAIFKPLRWDLWKNDRCTGKRVIHSSADRNLRRLRPFLGNIFRDLKIPRRERLGRLPEVNILYRACAWELSNQLSAPSSSRRGRHFACLAVVSKTWVFCPVMPGQMFQSTLFSVIFISLFLRFTFFMIVEYNTTLSYENVNKSTPYLFRVICVSAGFGRCSVAVTIVLAQNEIHTICIENRSV